MFFFFVEVGVLIDEVEAQRKEEEEAAKRARGEK